MVNSTSEDKTIETKTVWTKPQIITTLIALISLFFKLVGQLEFPNRFRAGNPPRGGIFATIPARTRRTIVDIEKDLFGAKARRRKGYYESILAKHDRDTFADRLHRFKWLLKVFPKGYGFAMSMESASIFDEAKMAFINSEYISTILLANAFLEHWLGGILSARGFRKEANSGLKSIIECLRNNNLLHDYLLEKIDRLRQIRNPFVHKKPLGHRKNLDQRVFLEQRLPFELLEKDAKEALSLMYQVAVTKFP